MTNAPSPTSRAPGGAPVIEVEDAARAFGATKALDGVDLVVPQGTVQGLLGPNGAGKTTLVRILATLLRPDRGRVRVGGIDVVANPTAVRSIIGLAGQFAAVDEALTGRENLEMVGRLYRLSATQARQRAAESLERLDLTEAADRTVRTYSGGMRRRLDLGASLVGRPLVLLLDEPTTGLDPRTRLDLWDFIRDLVADGTTVLLTTQYLEEADQLADDIVVIDRGRVIAQGSAEELKNRLGGDVLELRVPIADVERTLSALAPMAAEEARVEGEHVAVPLARGAETVMRAFRALDERAIVPIELSLRRPSLDDVFLTLTGGSHDDAATAPDDRELTPTARSSS
jgi:ABC-2 type transport system ATP-binding protein